MDEVTRSSKDMMSFKSMNQSGNKRVRLASLGYNRLFPPGYLKRYVANTYQTDGTFLLIRWSTRNRRRR